MADTQPAAPLSGEELAGLRAHYPDAERHADIHALLATIAAKDAEITGQDAVISRLNEDVQEQADRIDELKAERDALKAEVSALREITGMVDFWFAPWGAAKGAQWEWMTGDRPFDPNEALRWMHKKLAALTAHRGESGNG